VSEHKPAGSIGDKPEKSLVKPLDVDAVRTVQVGTVVWTIALLALLPFTHRLADEDRSWLLWTCLTGVLLGLAGITFTTRRRRRRSARPALRGADPARQAPPRAPSDETTDH